MGTGGGGVSRVGAMAGTGLAAAALPFAAEPVKPTASALLKRSGASVAGQGVACLIRLC